MLLKPFIDFNHTMAAFQHIEYTGCGSVGISSWDLVAIHRHEYAFLFLNLVEKEQIDNLNLPLEIKKEIITLDLKEDKFMIRVKNESDLETYLKRKKIDVEIIKKLTVIYRNHIKNNEEIKKKITTETSIGKKILDLWDKTDISHLSLTSVGIAIAASYFEQLVGEKIDIDIWIN